MLVMDRNPKWRFGDLVFQKTCAECSTRVEWQHKEPEHNNQDNFYYALEQKGWKKRWNLLRGTYWVCEKH